MERVEAEVQETGGITLNVGVELVVEAEADRNEPSHAMPLGIRKQERLALEALEGLAFPAQRVGMVLRAGQQL